MTSFDSKSPSLDVIDVFFIRNRHPGLSTRHFLAARCRRRLIRSARGSIDVSSRHGELCASWPAMHAISEGTITAGSIERNVSESPSSGAGAAGMMLPLAARPRHHALLRHLHVIDACVTSARRSHESSA